MHTMQRKLMISTLILGSFLFLGAGCLSVGDTGAVETTGPAGMFTSTDTGETWKSSSIFPTPEGVKSLQSVSVFDFIDDPKDKNTFYWASRGNGLFYSTDAGASWNRSPAPLNKGFIYSVAIHPEDHCTLYVTTGKQVFRSTDCVRSWSEIYRETSTDSVRSLAINPFSPYEIMMVKGKGDILMSNDAGVSWQVLARMRRTALVNVFADPNTQGRWYVASREKGLFRSDDSGQTWTDLSKPLKKFAGAINFRDMLVYPSKEGVLYWVSTYGILRSEDAGETWVPFELITPPGSGRIYGFAVNKLNEKEIYYTATIGARSTFYKSIDAGKNWITKKLPSAQVPTAIRIDPEKGETLYLGFTIPPKQ